MKKFLIKLIQLSIFLAIVYLLSLFVLINTKLFFIVPNISKTTGGYSCNLERFQEVENIDSVDILFLGSSHCYRGFDPRIIGLERKVFNLGNSAQTPYNSFYLAKEFLPKLTPKKVIFEGYWGALSAPANSIESGIDIISNKKISYYDFEMIFKQKNITSINSYFGTILYRLNHPLENEVQTKLSSQHYVQGGFVEHPGVGDVQQKVNKKIVENTIEYNPYQIEYLIKLIKLCQSEGIEIKIVRAPVSIELINSISNFEEITFELDSICKSHQIEFYDYCNPTQIKKMNLVTTEDFYDLDHLSQSGVKKFNDYLMTTIEL